jgi:hypothetical protein
VFEDGLQGRQHARLLCLHEHAERSAHRQSALLCDRSAGALIDEQQIGVKDSATRIAAVSPGSN